MDGIFYFQNPETNQLDYRVRVKQPQGIGNKQTRNLIASLAEINDQLAENHLDLSEQEVDREAADKAFDFTKRDELSENIQIVKKENQRLMRSKEELISEGLRLLKIKNNLEQDDNQEDLLVLAVLAWNELETDLFSKAINKIDTSKLKDVSFLNYLLALDSLANGNEEKAIDFLSKSIDEAPYAIEPKLLYLNILANKDFQKNKVLINAVVKNWEDDFDSDQYASDYSMVSLYYRLGTMFFINKDYQSSASYYEQAYDKLGILKKYFNSDEKLNRSIKIGLANALYMDGKHEEANEIFQEQLEGLDENQEQEQEQMKLMYVGFKQ